MIKVCIMYIKVPSIMINDDVTHLDDELADVEASRCRTFIIMLGTFMYSWGYVIHISGHVIYPSFIYMWGHVVVTRRTLPMSLRMSKHLASSLIII